MTDAKHTPGPWVVSGYYILGEKPEAGGIIIAQVGHLAGGVLEEVANARLMATAPKLLALLEELIDIEGPQPGHVEWYGRVRAAIAEARGDS